MAWDSEKDRLAILLQGDHPFAGHVLLFTTVQRPVMSAICLGPLYLPQLANASVVGQGKFWGGLAMFTGLQQGTILTARLGDGSVTVLPLAVGHRHHSAAASPVPAGLSASLSGTMF